MIVYLWFHISLWWHESKEKLVWKIAYLLPRKVALIAFVRVSAATGQAPYDVTYESAYKAWERGEGR